MVQSSFREISENCHFSSKMHFFFHHKLENLFFSLKCYSFSLQSNATNRFKIRAVYKEIHVFILFLCGVYMGAALRNFE